MVRTPSSVGLYSVGFSSPRERFFRLRRQINTIARATGQRSGLLCGGIIMPSILVVCALEIKKLSWVIGQPQFLLEGGKKRLRVEDFAY